MKEIFSISLKPLILKSVVFLTVWAIIVYLVDVYRPDLLDWPKLVSAIFANMFAFWIGYILTVLGFSYSIKYKRKPKKNRSENKMQGQ